MRCDSEQSVRNDTDIFQVLSTVWFHGEIVQSSNAKHTLFVRQTYPMFVRQTYPTRLSIVRHTTTNLLENFIVMVSSIGKVFSITLSATISKTAPISEVSLRLRAMMPSAASSPKMIGIAARNVMPSVWLLSNTTMTTKVKTRRVSVMLFASIFIDVVKYRRFLGILF